MRSGSEIGERGILALVSAGLIVGWTTACDVYKRDLLPQNTSAAGAPAAGRGGASGASAPEADGGDGAVAPALDAPSCTGAGDCWWSRGGVDDCRTAGMPVPGDRPVANPDSGGVAEIYLGFTQVRLGATRADGTRSEDAWEEFGFDLDGLCTSPTACNGAAGPTACKSPGPGKPYDGQLCRDNTFGRLQPVLAMIGELGDDYGLSEDAFNCELWRGGYNMLVRILGYNGTENDPQVRVDYYMSTGLEESVSWKCPVDDFRTRPRWRSPRTWGVDESGLTGPITRPGSLPESKFADPEAYVKNNYLVARVPDGSPQGFLGSGDPYRGFVFKPHGGLFVGRLRQIRDGTWEIGDGLLGGRIAKSDLVNAFRETGFCETGDVNSFYQSMLEVVNETSDMLVSGDVDANKDCDAMSYAIAFEASQLLPGQATKVPPRVACCAPGRSLEDCSAVCGDGKVNGSEKCDTAIEAGKQGACPTACKATDSCEPQTLVGSDCAAECKPMPITVVGAKDGCCPKGANVTSDSDCVAQCGNNVVETGETCDPPMSCRQCAPLNSCYMVAESGKASDCNLRCEQVKITACVGGDGCCPDGCTNANDSDCSASCGNSMLDDKETCEMGTNRPCPSSCDDRQACTIDASTGNASTCSLLCTHRRITAPANDDGCCPDGASANVDNDCQARCGNRFVEAGEQCDDGNDVAGDSCFECKTEDAGAICLMKQGNNPEDRCARCTCTKCAREALNCYNGESESDSRLCRDMVNCAYEKKCGNPDCFCGTASLFTCFSNANGPCKQRIQDAAKSESLLDIDVRGTDLNYPLGRANAVFTCRERSCASECGIR